MPEHSPEPWRLEEAPWREDCLVDAEGRYVTFDHPTSDDGHRCTKDCGKYREQEEANRARAIAAVNFCRHMSTEFLQQHRMVPIKSKDDITTDKGRPDFSEFHPAALIAVVAEKELLARVRG
jgi:hypothetical protein